MARPPVFGQLPGVPGKPGFDLPGWKLRFPVYNVGRAAGGDNPGQGAIGCRWQAIMNRYITVLILLWAVLSGTARAGAPQWVEVRSAHFTVVSDANEKEARSILDQLERMRWVFQKLYPKANVDPPDPIQVLAAKNRKTFLTVEPAPYLAKGQLNLAGYFLRTQDRNYVLLRLDAEEEQHPFATVYHEYTHLQFAGAGEWMPIWLNEGIAQFFQNTQVRGKEVLLGQPDTNDILYLRQQRLIPLPVLFRVDANSPYYHEEEKGSVFYAESWALTHYLQVTDYQKHTQRLQDYFQLMSQHGDPVAAAEKAFGNLQKLQSELEGYIRSGDFQQFLLNSAAAPLDESSYTARPLTPIEADAARADILANVQREKEARDLIASILKADPNNVRVRETMGEIEFRARNLDAARTWFSEAVKLDSKSYLANYYFAALSMQSGHADDPAIEPSLRAAIAGHPKFAPAYERLAVYLGMHHQNMEEAFSLIKTAVQLDPGNFYFRLNAGTVLVGMGKYDDAIAVLGAAVKLARNPEQVAQAQNQVENVTRIQQTRARFEQQMREYSSRQAEASTSAEIHIAAVATPPKHPAEAYGPKHSVAGVIHQVPAVPRPGWSLALRQPARVTAFTTTISRRSLSPL
jgi:Tfp pilus assembly protein PilF